MKYCCYCQSNVNTRRTTIDIGIAEIWNDHCSDCGSFVDSGFKHKKLSKKLKHKGEKTNANLHSG